MTENEIREIGIHADHLLRDEAFLTLWDEIEKDVSKDILRTAVDQPEAREVQYLTYAGMRHFLSKVQSYKATYDNLVLMQSQRDDANQEDVDDAI